MMDTSTVISLAAVAIALFGFILNSKKETKADAAARAVIQTKLDSLISVVNDIHSDLRAMRETVGDHTERLGKLELRISSVEQAIKERK